jgi:hypothetical protein
MEKLLLIYNCCDDLILLLVDKEKNPDFYDLCVALNGLIVNCNDEEYDKGMVDTFTEMCTEDFKECCEVFKEPTFTKDHLFITANKLRICYIDLPP